MCLTQSCTNAGALPFQRSRMSGALTLLFGTSTCRSSSGKMMNSILPYQEWKWPSLFSGCEKALIICTWYRVCTDWQPRLACSSYVIPPHWLWSFYPALDDNDKTSWSTLCTMHTPEQLAQNQPNRQKPGEINSLPHHHQIFSLFKVGPAP